ncbi:5'-deoxynucleotidase [Saccharospirillum mangrovi]|uniref:5'-deoxynucleotidase n=1 Tax=Saccharospirillum mangrovi TaxID=2161747 RepID=UPI000D3C772F|nr:5'-deoxynucleotidase [Saccharospirillum mangrovi]
MTTYRFFAYLGRLRWIKRWGLKRNVIEENVMEHSWQVATIAHALAVIRNEQFGGGCSPERVATAALYHDVSEIITGDLPSPIKYHSSTITAAYKAIEDEAEQEMLAQLPAWMQNAYAPFLRHQDMDEEVADLVKAADLISAYLKCQSELNANNQEFSRAAVEIERKIRQLAHPEVDYFMTHFVESYQLTLDELLIQHDKNTNPR